jgi:succinyl-diaminopimelate desuccinylase
MNDLRLIRQSHEKEVVQVCQKLLKIQSVNPPGDELAAAEYISGVLAKAGLEVELLKHSPARASVISRLRGSGKAPALLFNGHIDTVPVGAETWIHDPFSGAIGDGKVWGRGAADMKGGVAALMMALKVLADARLPLKGDILFAATAGEETNSLGATAIASRKDLGPVQAILIPEPSGNELYIAEKGAFWVELTTQGKTAHGSMPDLGKNAVLMMARLIAEFEKLEIPFQSHPLLDGFTRSVNTIAGGVKTNVIPDSCSATIDMRTVPGQDHRDILRQIEALIKDLEEKIPDFKASAKIINDRAPIETPANDPAVEIFHKVICEITGKSSVPQGTRYFTDGVVLVPALKAPLLICGPGAPGLAHQPNEYVEIDKVLEAVRIYTLAAMRFLN